MHNNHISKVLEPRILIKYGLIKLFKKFLSSTTISYRAQTMINPFAPPAFIMKPEPPYNTAFLN